MKTLRITFSEVLPQGAPIKSTLEWLIIFAITGDAFCKDFKVVSDKVVTISDTAERLKKLVENVGIVKLRDNKAIVDAALKEGDPFTANSYGWEGKICLAIKKMEFVDE